MNTNSSNPPEHVKPSQSVEIALNLVNTKKTDEAFCHRRIFALWLQLKRHLIVEFDLGSQEECRHFSHCSPIYWLTDVRWFLQRVWEHRLISSKSPSVTFDSQHSSSARTRRTNQVKATIWLIDFLRLSDKRHHWCPWPFRHWSLRLSNNIHTVTYTNG